MPHIPLQDDRPGIRGLVAFRPDTGRVLDELAEALLRSASTLSPADRERIAAYVSSRNDCRFCASSHAATSRHLLGQRAALVDAVIRGLESAPVDAKLRTLLVIAGQVQRSGRLVTEEDVAAASTAGATDARSTTWCASLPPSRCSIATWTPSRGGRRRTRRRTQRWGSVMAEQGYTARSHQITRVG